MIVHAHLFRDGEGVWLDYCVGCGEFAIALEDPASPCPMSLEGARIEDERNRLATWDAAIEGVPST